MAELPTTEKEWQRALEDAFGYFGYMVNHVYPLQTKTGYRTGTTLRGWPDLTAIGTGTRGGFLIFIEVKGPKTPVEAEQLVVLDELSKGVNVRAWLLRPATVPLEDIVGWMARPWDAPSRVGFDELLAKRAKVSGSR